MYLREVAVGFQLKQLDKVHPTKAYFLISCFKFTTKNTKNTKDNKNLQHVISAIKQFGVEIDQDPLYLSGNGYYGSNGIRTHSLIFPVLFLCRSDETNAENAMGPDCTSGNSFT